MEATLHQLGEILLKAVPTFLLVVLLHFYLKYIFFKPMGKVLHERYLATEGARKVAQESLARATAKTAEYEAAIRAARNQIYQADEQIFRQLQEKETAELTAARQHAEALVKEAKAQLARDVELAKAGLAQESELLANQIAESMLRRSAA
jgi:F-type H+-transporting ATPase subunit b